VVHVHPEYARSADVPDHPTDFPIEFYEDFSRHPQGPIVAGALSPVQGLLPWGVTGNTDFNNDGDALDAGENVPYAVIANGAVHAIPGGNIYLASAVSCPRGVIDATFEIEMRQSTLNIAGVTSPASGVNTNVVGTTWSNSRESWSKNGLTATTAGNTIVSHSSAGGGTWTITHYTADNVIGYQATKVSTANTPVGLTGWTIVTGSGQPVITTRHSQHTGGFTFAFKPTPNYGNPAGNADNTMHINFDLAGPSPIRYQPVGSPTVTLKSVSGTSCFTHANSRGRMQRFRVWASGTRLIIFYPGAMWEYEVSDGAAMIGPTTYFYFQTNRVVWAGLDAPDIRNYTALRRMWINAPFYDEVRPEMMSPIVLGGPSVHPSTLDILPGNVPYANVVQRNNSAAPLAVGGATVSANGGITGTSIYAESIIRAGIGMSSVWMPGVVPVSHPDTARLTPLQSPANAVATTALVGLVTPIELPAGSSVVHRLCGTYSSSGTTEILVRNNYGGWVTRFASGPIPSGTGVWTLEVRRLVHTGANRTLVCFFWSQGTGTVAGTSTYDRPANQWDPLSVNVIGVSLGDVTVLEHFTLVSQRS
jgi:hypothetical protein